MLERDIVRDILHWLRSQGFWAEKIHGSQYQRRGLPDIIACIWGTFVAIEVKRPSAAPTALQRRILEEIQLAGGIAFVATSVADVEVALRERGGR